MFLESVSLTRSCIPQWKIELQKISLQNPSDHTEQINAFNHSKKHRNLIETLLLYSGEETRRFPRKGDSEKVPSF